MKDSNGNLIKVTLFESYLTKFLIEHPDFFKSTYLKIFSQIQNIYALNEKVASFHRATYSIESLFQAEYSSYKNIADICQKFDLFAAGYYLKLYCDAILVPDLIENYQEQQAFDKIPSLSLLCQYTLFNQKSTRNHVYNYLKNPFLFDETNRGVVIKGYDDDDENDEDENNEPSQFSYLLDLKYEIQEEEDVEQTTNLKTRKLGIAEINSTPKDLIEYFEKSHEPSQFSYVPDRQSNVGKWLTHHNLPIITGSSGTARDFLGQLLKIVKLDPNEIQLLIISLAATLVAKGHHSYFEVMIILDRFGFKLTSTSDLLAFYEQTLPQTILTNPEYMEFKNSENGAFLLKDIVSQLDDSPDCLELPKITIG